MKRTLLTGGTGFVGANLARRLLNDGHEVHLLVRRGYTPWRIRSIQDDVQLHVVDMSDASALNDLVAGIKPDWIFHLAASGAYSWQNDLHEIIQTNFISTVNLVNACANIGFEAFVNTGSSSEYGYKDHPPEEDEWLEPNSHYAVMKASATLFCRYTAQSKQLHIPTLRLYSVYGSYEEPNRLIPTMIVRGLRGELPPLVNPDTARDYVYIEDVNNAYILAASQPDQETGAIYNVGTGVQTRIRDVVDSARRIMKISAEPDWGSMADRKWDTNVWVSNNEKIKSTLHWHPQYTFEQGFSEFIQWMLANPEIHRLYVEKIVNTR